MLVLVLNCGGSSIKYKLFDMQDETVVASGSVQDLGSTRGTVVHKVHGAEPVVRERPIPNHQAGLRLILDYLKSLNDGRGLSRLMLVAHKVAHGGPEVGPVESIDQRVMDAIGEMGVVVSVHNPSMLKAIQAMTSVVPDVPQVAVFETGFHHTVPQYATVYGLPLELAEKYGLRKYGFHGASHRYVSDQVPELLGRDPSPFRLISVHLGSGTSVAAIKDGRSIDISSGFTPQSGTMMSTRAGDFDPEVLYFLLKEEIVTLAELRQLLDHQCGLAGISGISGGDIRDIQQAAARGDGRAQLALNAFCYGVKKHVGGFAAVLGGVDALSFTGGIGENNPEVRERVCEGLEWIGVRLDRERNRSINGRGRVSTEGSPVAVFVLPTDEEVVVARQALEYWRTKGQA